LGHNYRMNEILAFCMGYLFKAIVGIILGKFVALVLADLSNWPVIAHYLDQHPTRWSANCHECKYGPTTPVDSITS
jgi:hypothetical protein